MTNASTGGLEPIDPGVGAQIDVSEAVFDKTVHVVAGQTVARRILLHCRPLRLRVGKAEGTGQTRRPEFSRAVEVQASRDQVFRSGNNLESAVAEPCKRSVAKRRPYATLAIFGERRHVVQAHGGRGDSRDPPCRSLPSRDTVFGRTGVRANPHVASRVLEQFAERVARQSLTSRVDRERRQRMLVILPRTSGKPKQPLPGADPQIAGPVEKL